MKKQEVRAALQRGVDRGQAEGAEVSKQKACIKPGTATCNLSPRKDAVVPTLNDTKKRAHPSSTYLLVCGEGYRGCVAAVAASNAGVVPGASTAFLHGPALSGCCADDAEVFRAQHGGRGDNGSDLPFHR